MKHWGTRPVDLGGASAFTSSNLEKTRYRNEGNFFSASSFFSRWSTHAVTPARGLPVFCMSVTVAVAVLGTHRVLAIYSCSCASAVLFSFFFEGRVVGDENSQICILNKCCDLYSYGRTGRITHTHTYTSVTKKQGLGRKRRGVRGK